MASERRRFIATASGLVAGAAAARIVDAPHVIAQPKFQWRLSTAYPPSLDQLHGAAQRLAQVVEESSGGRLRIEVFASGQIVQAFDAFDAASKGFHGCAGVLVREGARDRMVWDDSVRHES
jgi:TRAP-type mannitol/chloroaromatic compound transport system substrate-binding protein